MTTQLTLLAAAPRTTAARRGPEAPAAASPWRLDPTTRAIGHEGLAAARAALAAARPRVEDPFRVRPATETAAAA